MLILLETTDRDVIFYDPIPGNTLSVCICKSETENEVNFAGHGMLIRRPANCQSVSVAIPDVSDRNSLPDLTPVRPNFSSERAMWAATQTLTCLVIDRLGHRPFVEREIRIPAVLLSTILNVFYCKLENYAGPSRSRVIGAVYNFLQEAQRSNSQRVDELIEGLNMSRRNLQYYTSELFGFGPKKLVKYQSLRNVMRNIPGTVANGKGIGDLAYEHGFEHFSQFCADYRQMFGERPTDTLRRHMGN